MPWNVEYDSELRIVVGRYSGTVTDNDFGEATAKAIALAKGNNTNRFLIDDSEWEGGASVVGLFKLPEIHDALEADRTSKAAVILPPPGTQQAEDAEFYETVCRNRGWNVQVFAEREEAIEWLTRE